MEESPSDRDRVADERDRQAAERERQADERDRKADERERQADERDRKSTPPRSESAAASSAFDDGLFGITLGPKRELTEEVDVKEPATPTSTKLPARTLSDRLASAAADRDDPVAPDDEEDTPDDG